MLQTLLQNILPVLQNAATVIIPLALLLAFAAQRPGDLTKWLWRGCHPGDGLFLYCCILKNNRIHKKP